MTWTAPEITRTKPPLVADERTMLQTWLDLHRRTLLWKCAGLEAEQLKRRCVAPSTLSLLGLVRHLAECERGWFRIAACGEPLDYLYCSEDNPNGDFDDIANADAAADLATLHAEIKSADAAVADLSLDHVFTHRSIEFSLRWVYVHMIEEYARHNGHADFLRERIDGATGD
ncbi:DinB family protein [Nocardia pseudovaccinii]|uniref:DinB family protein n=1 Tax=Nocardia pseudovaccinii TaxID=189540 RepID=UPI0007A55580|nr:DinB family protein [Nocardia pseudovaccinii]